jgi:tetratricopeptide (TPR) repeat protein
MIKAISTARLTYSECYPELLPMLLNLSTAYENQKKFPDAIITLYSALSLASRVFGEKHMHYIIVIIALASLHYEIPDIEQAIKFQTKAVEMLEI